MTLLNWIPQRTFSTLCLWAFASLFSVELIAQPTTPSDAAQAIEVDIPSMGTILSVKFYSTDPLAATKAIDECRRLAGEVERILTDYDPDSETSQLTNSALEKFQKTSPTLWSVLKASDDWNRLSNGAFDASLGRLTRLWRTQRRTKRPTPIESLNNALKDSGWQHVLLNDADQSVQIKRPLQFDFGAIGKGFLVDRIYEHLVQTGLPRCLVNMSGNMRCGQPPPQRDGWRIEIAPLEKGQPPLRRLLLKDRAIATSGDLWQFYTIDGKRFSHILDPRTGVGIPGPIAATILSKTAADADACATAVCVLGPGEGGQLVERLPNTEAWILEHRQPDVPVLMVHAVGPATQDSQN